MAVVPPLTPYWGEVPQSEMHAVLNRSRAEGWREVIRSSPPDWQDNVMKADRAAFQDVLPIPNNSDILDVGAGMGCLAVELSRRHHVVALEGVSERAQFIALRKQQDHLENLRVLNADLNATEFDANQFDVIIVNGVLEWVGLFDTSVSPDTAQVRFLDRLRRALKPGGYIYVGIENRIGWNQLRGAFDHSGLRYTSLVPRFVADMISRRKAQYRSAENVGYRTYTYTHRGYRRLFRRAGLEIQSTWIAPLGYNLPTYLIPLNQAAIDIYTAHWYNAPVNLRVRINNKLKKLLARPVMWRQFGSDYVFLLARRNA
jgi:SAM-dependent methyltransferase